MHPTAKPSSSVSVAEGISVVSLPVEIDIGNASEVCDTLLVVLNRGAASLIIDLTRTTFCDCAGIHAIARAGRRAKVLGTPACVVLPPTGLVRKTVELTGLARQLPVLTGIQTAHRLLQAQPVEPDPVLAKPRAASCSRPQTSPTADGDSAKPRSKRSSQCVAGSSGVHRHP